MDEILILRKQGNTYKEIAEKLNVSINTIKTYCRRNRDKKGICVNCEKSINSNENAKQKRFCNSKCRQSWWNNNLDKVNRKANYKIVCNHCGEEFISYGNKSRKYCTHECYIKERFNGKRNI